MSDAEPVSVPPLTIPGSECDVTLTSPFGQNLFYLRKNSDTEAFQKLQKSLTEIEPTFENPKTVGDICLARSTKEDSWFRATISEINEEKYTVCFMDLGCFEVLDVSRIADCPGEFLKESPYAAPCSIVDIEPVHENYEICEEFMDICSGELISKTVKTKELNGKTITEVELVRHFPSQDKRPSISLKQFLIFAGYAQSVGDYHGMNLNQIVPTRMCPPLAVTRKTRDCRVLCPHVNSPSWFYLTLCDSRYPAVGEPLHKYMESVVADEDPGIKVNLPYKGLCCVVKDSVWLRARVTCVLDLKDVEVFYVDVGRTAIHSYDKLYLPHPRFLMIPGTAIQCRQTGIEPMNGKIWNAESIKRFLAITEKFSEKLMALFMEEDEKTGIWQVDLKVSYEDQCISVGQDLVAKNCAVFTGCSSASNTPKIKTAFEKERKTKRQRILEASDRKRGQAGSIGSVVSRDFPKDSLGNLRVEVYVVTVVSPAEIYVILALKKKHYDRMCELLAEAPKSVVDPKHVEVGETYCIKRTVKRFARAKVISKHEETVVVELPDEGIEMTVNVNELFELPEDFPALRPFASGVMLSHITPTCGQETWSKTSTVSLREMIDPGQIFYIVKSGRKRAGAANKKFLPVFMSWKEETPNGIEYPTFNQALVDTGLAFKAQAFHTEEISGPSDPSQKSSLLVAENNFQSTATDVGSESLDNPECGVVSSLNVHNAWPSAEPPDDKFGGITSFLDAEGKIFVQPYEYAEQIAEITNYFTDKYHNRQAREQDLHWNAGSPVIVRYHYDGKWYRGTVLAEGLEVKILFVDFGNTELCCHTDIRTEIDHYGATPILAYKCHLEGVELNPLRPADEKTLERIHSQTVGKKVEVVVIDTIEETSELKVTMKFYDSTRDVAKHMQMYSCFQPFSECVPKNLLWLPERLYETYLSPLLEQFIGDPIPIIVTRVEDVRNVFYLVKRTKETKSYAASMMKRYEDIRATWQNAEDMPDAKIEAGEMCLAYDKTFKSWERIVLRKVGIKCLQALWIDLGKSGVVSKHGLKQLPVEATLSPPAHQCLQIDVETPGNRPLSESDNKPMNEYFKSHDVLYASFKTSRYIPKAELFYVDEYGELKPCQYSCLKEF